MKTTGATDLMGHDGDVWCVCLHSWTQQPQRKPQQQQQRQQRQQQQHTEPEQGEGAMVAASVPHGTASLTQPHFPHPKPPCSLLLSPPKRLHIHIQYHIYYNKTPKKSLPSKKNKNKIKTQPPCVAESLAPDNRDPFSAQTTIKKKMGRSWQCHRMSNINC